MILEIVLDFPKTSKDFNSEWHVKNLRITCISSMIGDKIKIRQEFYKYKY